MLLVTVVVTHVLACVQGGFSPTKGAGDLVEGEGVDADPLQLRCVLEIANTGGRRASSTPHLAASNSYPSLKSCFAVARLICNVSSFERSFELCN